MLAAIVPELDEALLPGVGAAGAVLKHEVAVAPARALQQLVPQGIRPAGEPRAAQDSKWRSVNRSARRSGGIPSLVRRPSGSDESAERSACGWGQGYDRRRGTPCSPWH